MNVFPKPSRRSFLNYMAYAMGGIAVGASGFVMIDSMNTAADVWGKPVAELDLKKIKPGERVARTWLAMPYVIYHRTQEDIAEVRAEDWRKLRDPQSDEMRVQKGHEEWLVVKGVCTRHACQLMGTKYDTLSRGRWGGWLCPCCSSSYDKSGRVRNGPAPKNLSIPYYTFEANGSIRIVES